MAKNWQKWLKAKVNGYFVFIAVALTISAYLLIVDNSGNYVSQVDILVSPKNEKTAIYLDKIRKNIVVISQKNATLVEAVNLTVTPEDSLIEVSATAKTKEQAKENLTLGVKKMLETTSRYYDIKNDLTLEIVSQKTVKENAAWFLILVQSIIIGSGLSLLVQFLLDGVEKLILFFIDKKKNQDKNYLKTRSDLDNFFKINREKIQKLSSVSEGSRLVKEDKTFEAVTARKEILFSEPEPREDNFKKASFPVNLPIAQEEISIDEPIYADESMNAVMEIPAELAEQVTYPENLSTVTDDSALVDSAELKKTFTEPTEEDFKRKLNQLLGNK